MRPRRRGDAVVATLGDEPQVVTISLDCLLSQGYSIQEVAVVHTFAPSVLRGLRAIDREFVRGRYPGVALRRIGVEGRNRRVTDFQSDSDVRDLLRVLYRTIREAKIRCPRLHLCLAGGRKVMGIAAMVVAQLLFGPDDRAWYLLSEEWTPGRPRRMHLDQGKRAYLVPVPVLRWTDSAVMLGALADLDDPAEAIRRYEEIVRGERMRRRREFVERWLTPAERDVAHLACRGLDNAAIARRLGRSERTVANQLTSVYAKLEDWLGFPGSAVHRATLLAELVPYFELTTVARHPRENPFLAPMGASADARRADDR